MEIDLLTEYPKTKRPERRTITEQQRAIARKFGREFFDGDRTVGYGGYKYDPKYWVKIVKKFQDFYKLPPNARVLDVGCAKGFMLCDFLELLPKAWFYGLDISRYALSFAKAHSRIAYTCASCNDLPYRTKTIDLVISINTVHNLPLVDCKEAIREIQRVGHKAYITVDAWRNKEEKERMMSWNLTALTLMSVDDWKQLFRDCGYTGDYWWFIP